MVVSEERKAVSGSLFALAITFFPGVFLSHGNWLVGAFLLAVQVWAFNFHEFTLKLRKTGRWVLVYFVVVDVLGAFAYFLKQHYPDGEDAISLTLSVLLVVLVIMRRRCYRTDEKMNVYPR